MSNNTFLVKAKKVWGNIKRYFNIQKILFEKRKVKLKKSIKELIQSKDFKFTCKAVVKVILDGFFISGLLFPFIGFNWIYILPYGSGWYFLRKQLIPNICKLLSSINIIKIGK